MTQRILVMGLPGAGKTRLAHEIACCLVDLNKTVAWYNADAIREKHNDWDFSEEGRLRQAVRMRELADSSGVEYAICDFVAPLEQMRTIFQAHCLVWVDTISHGRYTNTNLVFDPPKNFDLRVTEQNASKFGELAVALIVNKALDDE